MNRNEFIARITAIVDSACWDARDRYGHADYGLDDYDTCEELDFHPSAHQAAIDILDLLEENS